MELAERKKCRGDGQPKGQQSEGLGGEVTAPIAENLVHGAWTELLTLVTDEALAKRAAELREQWAEATMDARRDLLREVIERVELVARPPGNRHGRKLRPGHRLRIHWQEPWGRAAFGYVGATSVISRADSHITSATGKSWKQWRQMRLLGPQ